MEKIESLKQEVKKSSEKIFEVAEQSLAENEDLEKVVIFKRMFRCDPIKDDPTQIKNKLSEFGNSVLDDLWLSKGCPKKINIVQQSLECSGDLLTDRFGSPMERGFDGIHMRGKMAVQHYTGSVINALVNIIPGCKPIKNVAAQPQPVRTHYQSVYPVPQSHYKHRAQYKQRSAPVLTPATGANRMPVGGDRISSTYNIRTQNKFSAVAGN